MHRNDGSCRVLLFQSTVRRSIGSVVGLCLMLASVSPLMAAAMNPAGPGWIGAQQISNNNLVYPAVIAANEQGKAIAVWTQDDGAPEQYGVWVNWYTPMKGWAQPKRINNYVGQADEIAVALNNEGQAE